METILQLVSPPDRHQLVGDIDSTTLNQGSESETVRALTDAGQQVPGIESLTCNREEGECNQWSACHIAGRCLGFTAIHGAVPPEAGLLSDDQA